MAKILTVDDDAAILSLIRRVLEKDGHAVTTAADASEVLALPLETFELILLDVMMPGMDGFSLCLEIRGRTDCPILFLTAKTLEEDMVYGLGIGADDYLTKPFGTAELRARVGAHLRREQREHRNLLSFGTLTFNLSGKELLADGVRLALTRSEYAICEFLARNRGQVFSKEQIYEKVFGYDGESDSSAIAEHIKNIRAKLGVTGVAPIETVWGIGYKWRI